MNPKLFVITLFEDSTKLRSGSDHILVIGRNNRGKAVVVQDLTASDISELPNPAKVALEAMIMCRALYGSEPELQLGNGSVDYDEPEGPVYVLSPSTGKRYTGLTKLEAVDAFITEEPGHLELWLDASPHPVQI